VDDAAGLSIGMASDSTTLESTVSLDTGFMTTAAEPAIVTQPSPTSPVNGTATANNYVLPNLNFRWKAEGTLETRVGAFAWKERKRVLRERRERTWGALGRLGNRLFRSQPAILLSLPLILLLLLPNLFIAALVWFALTACMVVCTGLDVLTHLPNCRRCSLRMALTARWTRLCKSREDVIFGYRDCLAALKHGLWQDAAKLLSLYGAEYVSEYGSRFITPSRYHVSFFECTLCGHHTARLTTDEMVAGRWEEQIKFAEAYWGNITTRPPLLSVLVAFVKTYPKMLPELVRGFFKKRLSRRMLMICALVPALLLAFWLLFLLIFWLALKF
jgi:hypothetical protein